MPGEQRIGPGIAPGRIGAGSRSALPGIPDDADVYVLEDESCMPRPTH